MSAWSEGADRATLNESQEGAWYERQGDEQPGHGRPHGLPDLAPVDVVARRASVIVSKPLDGPDALFGREEPRLGRVVVQLPVWVAGGEV